MLTACSKGEPWVWSRSVWQTGVSQKVAAFPLRFALLGDDVGTQLHYGVHGGVVPGPAQIVHSRRFAEREVHWWQCVLVRESKKVVGHWHRGNRKFFSHSRTLKPFMCRGRAVLICTFLVKTASDKLSLLRKFLIPLLFLISHWQCTSFSYLMSLVIVQWIGWSFVKHFI